MIKYLNNEICIELHSLERYNIFSVLEVQNMNILKKIDVKKTGIFAAGVLFGTAGIKILSSKDAKKIYTQCTAAVLRAKDCVMKTVTNIQENAEDIYSEAMQINEECASENSEFDDESETEVENDTMKTEE